MSERDETDAGDSALAAVVEKPRTQVVINALRAEGVYDDSRSTFEAGGETVGVPVTEPPTETEVLEVVRAAGETRMRTLEDRLRERGWSDAELERAPGSWAVIGSVVLVDVGDAPRPAEVGEALLATHGGADTVLARRGVEGPHREPDVEVLAGEGDTETVHREHGTEYALDLAEVMFSPGNKSERARMGEVCDGERGEPSERASGETASDGERTLDAFAGVGYFTLPIARAGARVTAVERNPAAFEYLLENAVRNGVTDRVRAYRGDCREVVPALDGGFDRAVLGHYDAHEHLEEVLPALAPGGTVHVHAATPEDLVPDRPVGRLEAAAEAVGRTVVDPEVRDVKGYSEGVRHVVTEATVE